MVEISWAACPLYTERGMLGKQREREAKDVDEEQSRPESGSGSGMEDSRKRTGISWVAMLTWIAVAFLLAGLVAYRLVTPFFHRG